MRISTWKEVTDEVNKVVVYGYYDGEEFPERVYIKYPNNTARVIEEDFPITKPDYNECSDYYSTLDKFNEDKVGVVSDLETTGDVAKLKQDFEKLKESSIKYIILPSDESCDLPTLTVNDACTRIGMKYGQGAIMEFTDWWFDGKKDDEEV